MNPARPPALADLGPARQVHLDVRPDIGRGEEPFARIMETVRALGPGQVLVLRAPFEPVPLYGALGKRGFLHWTERRAAGDVTVWFYRAAGPGPGGPAAGGPIAAPAAAAGGGPPARVAAAPDGPDGPAAARTLDVRGLEAPAPMMRVLEALETLRPGERIEIHHDRRPVLLYPIVEERGFTHATDEPEPGLVRIVIARPGTPA